jgi:hypothetical protein
MGAWSSRNLFSICREATTLLVVGLLPLIGSGTCGVRFVVPATAVVVHDHDDEACFQDVEHAVLWRVVRSPWRTDLGPESLQLLRFDVERHARGMFEAVFEPTEKASKPKTSDAEWSPLVEAQTQLRGGRLLRVVHRTRHQPDGEVVEGRVIVPTAEGTVSISAVASADEAGERELRVLARHRAEKGSVRPQGRGPQAIADDAQWDKEYPDHPLSRVRAALDWLVSPAGGALEVVTPDTDAWVEHVTLEEASSIISAPARFLRVPRGRLPVPPTMAVLSRVVLAADERPRTVCVWRVEDVSVKTDHAARLREIVSQETVRCGAGDGAKVVESRIMSTSATATRAEIIEYVRFEGAGGAGHAMQCWFTDTDGAVFRIAAGGPRYAPSNDLWEDMAQVTRSWRRIPDSMPRADEAPTSKTRRWWPFW